jgi:hypothetical protein
VCATASRWDSRWPSRVSSTTSALRTHREGQSAAARARWTDHVRALGFDGLESYLAARKAEGVSAHRVRTELGCGGTVAERLLSSEWCSSRLHVGEVAEEVEQDIEARGRVARCDPWQGFAMDVDGGGKSPWETARSLADLAQATVAFLRGDLDQTPIHGGPPNDETDPLVPALVEMNEAGFVTTDSQPGVFDSAARSVHT